MVEPLKARGLNHSLRGSKRWLIPYARILRHEIEEGQLAGGVEKDRSLTPDGFFELVANTGTGPVMLGDKNPRFCHGLLLARGIHDAEDHAFRLAQVHQLGFRSFCDT